MDNDYINCHTSDHTSDEVITPSSVGTMIIVIGFPFVNFNDSGSWCACNKTMFCF